MGRVLAIGLDGFEVSYADRLVAEGALPTIASLRHDAANVLLVPGKAHRTGLSWEHFWSGLDDEASGRESPVEFDPSTYRVWQEGARFSPFFAERAESTVVFDTPYADLARAKDVRGVVAWGAHDPGFTGGPAARPPELLGELNSVVGRYPATKWTYATPWASPEDCRVMGRDLAEAVGVRETAARWLLTEKTPDWELAIVVVAELHSGTEGLWHGVDPSHPLHGHPSAHAAGDALRSIYVAADRLVADLCQSTEPTTVVVFSMGGMGPNTSDVASMALLPELLYRWAWGKPLLQMPDGSSDATTWDRSWYGHQPITKRVPLPIRRLARKLRPVRSTERPVGYLSLDWQPASWYRFAWPKMRAFALPSFYDGRIRVNLRGREANGIVDLEDYESVCDELEQFVRACVDPLTGEPVVEDVERMAPPNPFELHTCGADLGVIWRGSAVALDHPEHGRIGPMPHRRTGGHTGPYGWAALTGEGVSPGNFGTAAAADVAPTILDLIGVDGGGRLSGASLLDRLQVPIPGG